MPERTKYIIKIGSRVIFKTSKVSNPRLGIVKGIDFFKGEIRYKIYRLEKGRFLNGDTAWEALQKTDLTIEDTRWCFFMWLKSERILKVLEN